ncbi:uncharacterized protein LOC121389349 [Gigantopelta aegis]|uniref:uncharacterized protein LOC121389349 n=1 Tax=Gigantopelta aegis TaxID=1735272 RepID=UPI001B8877E9|nr:uncharacterized protein LOC121389349 [Gigantopelta aegis]
MDFLKGHFIGHDGKCFYKNKAYSHGQKWDDGCDYECVCENGQTGSYRCYNKCPLYYDLPSTCTLVATPGECCLKPVCNFQQNVQITEGSGLGKTPSGISVCEYGGKQYYQDQTWEVGCDFKCSCFNARSGAYRCQSYCPVYSGLPSICKLVKSPGSCCATPSCKFNQQVGSFTGTGSVSSSGSGTHPTQPPVCQDVLGNCQSYSTDACKGSFLSWSRQNCRKYCNLCDEHPTPSPSDVCIYNGVRYHQGVSWRDGCDKECTCEQAIYGYYRCVNRCPTYSNLPAGCYTAKKSGDCCESVQCTRGTFVPSSTNLLSIGNGGGMTIMGPGGHIINVLPTLPSGGTPGSGGTGMQSNRLNGCLFKGQLYVKNQQWTDGCTQICVCVDETTGMYQCRSRCPDYQSVPAQCARVADPSDICCTVPHCPQLGYVPIPFYGQSVKNIGAVKPPSYTDLVSGTFTFINTIDFSGGTVAPPTAPSVTSGGGIGYCEYKGKHYSQSQRWEDGCQYNCVCEDASTGFWRCVEKCRQYNNLPKPYCGLVPDPSNSCCKVPHCVFPAQVTDLIGTLTQPPFTVPVNPNTPPSHFIPTTPKPAYCEYQGKHYSQAQVWYDGCSSKCVCDNAQMGVYRCTQRCPEYKNIPTVGCTLVPDPKDPVCCKIPECHFTPTSGSIMGHGNPPTLPPGSFVNQPNPKPIGHCEYKGQTYKQADKWTDGCQYTCTCEDAVHGQYRCTEMCPRYPPMPAGCFMRPDFANPCCKKPDCSFTGSTGQISGQGHQTPAPNVNTPKPGSTNIPKPSYCVYKGVKYTQGQTWQDGCNLDCRCEDSQNGLYTCDNRCPTYSSLPPQCSMVTDPKDPCCQIPSCQFPATQGQVIGTLAPHLLPTAVPGVITGTAKVPVPTPGPGGHVPTPLKLNFCVYKGVHYRQSQEWSDGCDYTCKCEDESTGRYVCKEKCPRYTNLPAQCRLNKDPANPCCSVPSCIFTPTNTQITGTGRPTTKPGVSPNPAVNPTPHPKDVCVYRGQSYSQGQTWYDGCDFKCVCEDGTGGVYRCNNRCPSYKSIPKECSFVPDPKDPFCCRVPKCTFNPSQGQITGHGIPTLPPGQITGGSATPAPTPGSNPTPNPGATPAYKNMCIYHGKTYKQGQRWQDGCDYDCECINSMEGKYKCVEKCSKYPSLPAQCHLQRDVYNPCCYKPVCDFTGTSGLVTGKPPATTAPAFCTYNGVPYKQGETWNDGCQLKCSCEDAKTNIYRCDTRCPQYPVMPGCTLVLDPRDPCCSLPSCPMKTLPTLAPGQTPPPGQTPAPQLIPTIAPGIVQGQTVSNNTQKTCLYHGVVYHQGQKWDDGCRYRCECIDEHTGRYVCHERCSQYPNVPSYCTMGVDPADQCCKKPQCNLPPVVSPTPNPQHQVSPTPGQHNTPVPQPRNYCEYKNARYVQGQQWFDGCEKTCVCEDGKTGYYRCNDRCAKYPNVPSQCSMVADPKDPQCCQVPQCLPTPGPNGFPTPRPGQNPIPTIVTNVPGVITGKAPTPTPGSNGQTPTPRKACIYNGNEYHQGQRWQDGCNYNCVCENEVTGSYRCEERCPKYPFVPPTCTLIRDSSDYCCYKMSCVNKPTPNPFQTPSPGSTLTPNPHPNQTPAPHNTPSPNYCVYQGIPFRQGQEWNVGCSQKCRCDDASNNYYTCFDRCATHKQQPGCRMVVDPSDACCRIPLCSLTPSPNMFPTPGPGQSPRPNPYPVPQPTIVPPGTIGGSRPNINPLTNQGFCVYKGKQYKQGDKWQDGCDYNCVCIDDSTGQYTCTEKCSKIISIPSFCTLIQDPYDVCCKKPSCATLSPTPNPQHTPKPGFTTLAPPQTPVPQPREVCVYMGLPYTQGQQWYDGCDKKCICADGKTGFYTCSDRCPKYTNMDPSCVMVPDPTDPVCCQAPQCSSPTGKTPIGITGSVTGIGKPPTPTPHIAPTPKPGQTYPPFFSPAPGTTAKPKPVCVYKGVAYSQGQRWADGCDYMCVCIDGIEGKYKCTERCPKYPNLPATCRMVYDSSNPCCYKPDCSSHTPTPGTNITPIPGQNPTPSPLDVCVYNGVPFRQGQTWNDGCSKTCRCEDSMTGLINCDDRCLTYPQLKPGCTMITDPSDPCCQIPKCTKPDVTNPDHTLPGIPGTIHGSSLPTNQNPNTRNNVCIYHGRSYKQGQTWEDGCSYTCECLDSMTGQYRCNEKCAKYTSVPPSCSMMKDPNNQCCMVPYCPSLFPTHPAYLTPLPMFTPSPGATFPPYFTPAPHQTFPPQMTLPPGVTPVPGGTLPPNLTPQPGKTYAPNLTFPPLFTPFPGVTFPHQFTPAPGKTFAPSMTLPPGLVPVPGQTLPPQLTPAPGKTYPPSVTFPFIPGPTLPPYLTPAPGKTYPPNLTLPPQFVPTPGATLPPGLTPLPGQTYPPGFSFPTPGRPLPSELTPAPGKTYAPSLTLPPGLIPTPGMTLPPYFTPAPGQTFPQGFTFPTPTPTGHRLPPQLTPAPGRTYAPSVTFPPGFVPTPGQTLPPNITPAPGQTYPPGFTYPTPPGYPLPPYLTPAPGKTYAPSVTLPYNLVPTPGQTLPPNITPVPGQTFPPGYTFPSLPGHPLPPQLTPAPGKTYAPSVTLPYNVVPTPGQTLPPNVTPVPGQTFPPGFTFPTPTGRPLPPQLTPAPGQTYAPSVTLPPNFVPTPGQTLPPYLTPTPGQTFPPGFTFPTPTPHMKGFCVYKNAYYREQQIWYDGCNAVCRCESGDTGSYRCQERCSTFKNVAPGCTLMPDPKDPACCKVPSCPVKPVGATPTPGYLPVTGSPGQVTGLAPVPTQNPYLIPVPGGQTPVPNPYATPQPKTGCMYKGVIHKKGDTWDDGCDYTCACLDDMTGQYKCTEKCVRVPNPPPQCVMLQDPKNPCCKVPYCDFMNPTPFPGGLPTPNPNLNPSLPPGQKPTPPHNPTPGFCVYKGSFYRQGQQWNDGCSQECVCDDTSTGHYTCKQRCASYPSLSAGCVFKTDPADSCCLVPDCTKKPLIPVFPGTGPGPSGTNLPSWATKGPGISGTRPPYVVPVGLLGTFTGTGVNPNPGNAFSGHSGVCVYKTKVYKQGEKWNDGCNFRCECIDQLRGKYRCTDRCPKMYFLPPQCFKVTDPKDSCCQEVHCNPAQFPTPPPGTFQTPTPAVNPTPKVTAPHQTGKPFTPAILTGPSGTKPATAHTTFNSFSGTKPPNVCRYKDGTMHKQGETWTDGCDYTCECKNPLTNDYHCEQRCATYTSIPSFCQLTPDPADVCCKKPVCSYNGQMLVPMPGNPKHPPLVPTLSPSITNVVPLGTHEIFSGTGLPPGQSVHYGQGQRSVCMYKGTIHQPGESWDDGCKYTCTCKDSEDGQYECISKCPTYPAIPSYCKFIDVAGQCCPSLSCNIPGVGNYNPVPMIVPTPVPTPMPGQSPNMVPTPGAIQAPQIIVGPGQGGMVGGSGLSGHGAPVPTGISLITGGINDKCVYKNRMYNQGEHWDDGCNYQCECVEARSGFFKCIPKCPKYDVSKLTQQGCYLVTTPAVCCQRPMCRKPDGTVVNPLTAPGVYPIVGSFTGGFTGFRPGYTPGTNIIINGRTPGCVYNGHLYRRGETWTDGCKYDCACLDSDQGQYQCHPKCPQYSNLPPACRFVQPPQGQCCQQVTCNIVTTPYPVKMTPVHITGACKDVLPNCVSYGKKSCKAPYIQWAKTNCPAYCNFCPNIPVTSPNPAQTGCVDKLTNCASYGKTSCLGQYEHWARDNCQLYCGYCSKPQSGCHDVLTNCHDYGKSSCAGLYLTWAKTNCALSCGLCPGQVTTPLPAGLGIPPQGWTILLKGVAGAPGDLFSLWASPNTQNEHVPAAQLMTAQFPQHYKPDLSNHWSECHFDKVMVGIYNNGVEKANIIFDARNSDKMNWFRPERIISSTWNDIRYAPLNIFRLSGDPSTGREFYASSSGFGCDVNGWFMVSTRSGCSFEPSSSGKPAFYYVKGNQKGKFSQSSLGSGDVFAILAQGGNCDGTHPITPTSFTHNSNVCVYKGKFYKEHQTWKDGCQYNCTCEDAKTGFYRCLDICPVYSVVPSGCKLTKKPGECCEKLDCINNGNFCYYKNKAYAQGQSWNDGCDYKCTCKDATRGYYRCETRCLEWTLPKVCKLIPPGTGMCCKTPSCPAGIVVNYPPGWVPS